MITINSFGTELSKDDRVKLYPKCGKLYPDGLSRLARADDYDQVRQVAEFYTVCSFLFVLFSFFSFLMHSLVCLFVCFICLLLVIFFQCIKI